MGLLHFTSHFCEVDVPTCMRRPLDFLWQLLKFFSCTNCLLKKSVTCILTWRTFIACSGNTVGTTDLCKFFTGIMTNLSEMKNPIMVKRIKTLELPERIKYDISNVVYMYNLKEVVPHVSLLIHWKKNGDIEKTRYKKLNIYRNCFCFQKLINIHSSVMKSVIS